MSGRCKALVLQCAKRDISETQLPYVLMCLVEMPACTFLGFFRLVARRERLDDFDDFIAFFLIARTRAAVMLLSDFRPDGQYRTSRLGHDVVDRADFQVRGR